MPRLHLRLGKLLVQSLIPFLVCEAILYESSDGPDHGPDGNGPAPPPAPLNPCDGLAPDECRGHPGCGYAKLKCFIRIAWLHIPKTASSFGTTLAHIANPSLPKDAQIDNGPDPVREFFEKKFPADKFFQYVFRNPTNPGDFAPISGTEWKDWKGFWVTMFRHPEVRVNSAWHSFARGKGDLLAFQKKVQGQQASMISLGEKARARVECERDGGGQNGPAPSCDKVSDPDPWRAIDRIKGFTFVGIFEEYDLSICLFHTLYRSECRPVEFNRIQETDYRNTLEEREAEISLLKQNKDPFDTPLYEAALNRFRGDCKLYNVNRETCRTVCPGGPFDEK